MALEYSNIFPTKHHPADVSLTKVHSWCSHMANASETALATALLDRHAVSY